MLPDFYLFPRCETVLTVRGDTKPRRFSCVFILRLITEALHSWRRQIFIFNRSWTFNGRQEVGDACCGVPAAGRDGPWNRLIFVDMGGYPKIPSVKGKLRAGWWFLLPYIFQLIFVQGCWNHQSGNEPMDFGARKLCRLWRLWRGWLTLSLEKQLQ